MASGEGHALVLTGLSVVGLTDISKLAPGNLLGLSERIERKR
jgi:hypothetical protein